MSGEIGRKEGEDAFDPWIYAAEVRILDRKGMGGGRGIVEYPGVPLPDEDMKELGLSPGDQLGLCQTTEKYPGVQVNSIEYSFDGSGDKKRQIRGGTESKPTWVISVPFEWSEPAEYPIDPDEETSFLPLEDGDHVVLELDRNEEVLRLYRNEDYRYHLGGIGTADFIDDPEPSAPLLRPFYMPDVDLDELLESMESADLEEEKVKLIENAGMLAMAVIEIREEMEIDWDELELP